MLKTRWMVETAVLGLVFPAYVLPGQTAPSPRLAAEVSASASVQVLAIPNGEVVREIDDPHTGDRWLLARDQRHPGGPGLLILVSSYRAGTGAAQSEAATPAPVIRPGDRVIVEQNTAVAEAHLEAVAMNPAITGSAFNARLSLGGRVVRAVALGPHRAVFEEEARR